MLSFPSSNPQLPEACANSPCYKHQKQGESNKSQHRLLDVPSHLNIFRHAQVPANATWEELRDALPYDDLKDPTKSPMTAEDRQILEEQGGRLAGQGSHGGFIDAFLWEVGIL